MTKIEQLLCAASAISETSATFTESELIVAAWHADHAAFGMKGYESTYPCSNRGRVNICGKRGMISLGLLTKVSACVYSLSERGKAIHRRIQAGELNADSITVPPMDPALKPNSVGDTAWVATLSTWVEEIVGRYRVWKTKRATNIDDACEFWGCQGTSALMLGAITEIKQRVQDCKQLLLSRKAEVELKTGYILTRTSLNLVADLNKFLADHYKEDIWRMSSKGR